MTNNTRLAEVYRDQAQHFERRSLAGFRDAFGIGLLTVVIDAIGTSPEIQSGDTTHRVVVDACLLAVTAIGSIQATRRVRTAAHCNNYAKLYNELQQSHNTIA